MAKMSDSTLKAMLASEYAQALAATNASKLSLSRSDATDYYLGNLDKDMPAAEGRSKAVSMDTSDTIEGLMPGLMDVFCSSDDVVRFDPVGPEDVEGAEQETDYVNHVFMNQNNGFLVLYSFIKDALLHKVGVVKVWAEKSESEVRETYYDKTEDEYALIVANPDVEVVEHTEHAPEAQAGAAGAAEAGGAGDGGYEGRPGLPVSAEPGAVPGQAAGPLGQPQTLHDVTVVERKNKTKVKILGVPPEEFGIERGARSLRECNYCFHKVIRTESQLIEQGYDAKQVRALQSYTGQTDTETINRDTVEEHQIASDDLNKAAREIVVIEHYVRMDYAGDGKACLYRVVTGSQEGEILKRDGKPDIEQFDVIPFAAMTPIIMTHRFFGRSVADLVKDITQIKTALLRGGLDNFYLHNNQRVEVAESHASENTLDDLLVSRPGGIIRTKSPGGIQWQTVPDITKAIWPALEYFDSVREWRTGVTRTGQGIDANALVNQTATAAKQEYNAAQAKEKLIARVFAETGIKDLFSLLHATIKKHGQEAAVVRLRNQWVNVDPRNWKTREDLTVHVGLGDGGRAEQAQHAMAIMNIQKEMLINKVPNIVQLENLYNAAADFTKAIGHKDGDRYFTNPAGKPLPPPQPDPKIIELQMKSQLEEKSDQRKAQIETVQAQADIATQDRKTTAELALAERKAQLEERLALIEADLKREAHQQDMAMKQAQHEQTQEREGQKFVLDGERQRTETNSRLAEKGQAIGDDGQPKLHPVVEEAVSGLRNEFGDLKKLVTAKRKSTIHRDPKTNRVSHATHEIEA